MVSRVSDREQQEWNEEDFVITKSGRGQNIGKKIRDTRKRVWEIEHAGFFLKNGKMSAPRTIFV